jgi:hypothetical protein
MPTRRRPVTQTPATDLNVEWVEIGRVRPYEQNPRMRHDVVAIANSLKTFGWQQPLVVDPDYVLIVGHGRLLAAQKLGEARVPVHVARNLSPAQAKAYRLADNKSAEGAVWDEPKLILELQGLRETGEDELVTMAGFDLASALDKADAQGEGGGADTEPQFTDGLAYRVIVECADESDQGLLIERLEGEGRSCRALIS